jgi:hypothetical protein
MTTPSLRSLPSRVARQAVRIVGAVAIAGTGAALLAPAAAHAATGRPATTYSFREIDNSADPTFNQLLGINNDGTIAGYFGSGAPGHPNKGYTVLPPYGTSNFVNENFPGSVQTQVTAINGKGDTAGFWVDGKNNNHGFIEWNGVFTSYNDPNTPHMTGSVNQLLGINNKGIAVGFYVDANGNSHAYSVNQATGVFTKIHAPGVSKLATGINNEGDIVGDSTSNGVTFSWLISDGKLTTFQFPGGSDTQALGINNHDEIVGSYLDGSGVMHGFVLTDPTGPHSVWQSVDDPNGIGSTVVNGLNGAGDLVGFYTDAAGNTDGFLATP